MDESPREQWMRQREKIARRQKRDQILYTSVGVLILGSIFGFILFILMSSGAD